MIIGDGGDELYRHPYFSSKSKSPFYDFDMTNKILGKDGVINLLTEVLGNVRQ
tara:strand:+ start:526 stop:684 length:159 start_codon:yes stop_codon:yes gene_type:complete